MSENPTITDTHGFHGPKGQVYELICDADGPEKVHRIMNPSDYPEDYRMTDDLWERLAKLPTVKRARNKRPHMHVPEKDEIKRVVGGYSHQRYAQHDGS